MSRRVEISTLLPPITLSIATISCIVFLLTISSSPSPCHAFAPTSSRLSRHYTLNEKIGCSLSLASSEAPNTPIKSDAQNSSKKNNQLLTHADIEWRLRPPEGTSRLDRLKIELGANIIRADRKLRGLPSPPLLCPKGGRALLEAYYKEPGRRKKEESRSIRNHNGSWSLLRRNRHNNPTTLPNRSPTQHSRHSRHHLYVRRTRPPKSKYRSLGPRCDIGDTHRPGSGFYGFGGG